MSWIRNTGKENTLDENENKQQILKAHFFLLFAAVPVSCCHRAVGSLLLPSNALAQVN
jgi:hypothetical protein